MMKNAVEQFRDDRFGMFIHWGLYSLLAGEWQGQRMDDIGEWIMSYHKIPIREYEKLARQFNPTAFDADAIARLARAAGMRYLVITSKHHDGFALFHSKADPYNVVDATPFGRDIIGELALACKKHGLKFGLYYSQSLDWHEKNAGGWDDPAYLPPRRPWGNIWDFPDNTGKDFAEYFSRKVLPQVEELLTNYGDIYLLWFDTPLTISQEQSQYLYDLVKRLQPDCLVNSRLGNGLGDYASLGDNQLPAIPLDFPTESPVTLNDTWGYKWYDLNWKRSPAIIDRLARLASKNTNLLLNIGPRGDGSIPEETSRILEETGAWTRTFAAAVFGTRGNPCQHDFTWGSLTTAQEKLYCLVCEPMADLSINGLETKVLAASSLATGQPVAFSQNLAGGRESLQLDLSSSAGNWSVYCLELAGPASFKRQITNQHRGEILLPPHLAASKNEKAGVLRRQALGERYKTGQGPAITAAGTLTGWQDKQLELAWQVQIRQPGAYRVFFKTPDQYKQPAVNRPDKLCLVAHNEKTGWTSQVSWAGIVENGSAGAQGLLELEAGSCKMTLKLEELAGDGPLALEHLLLVPEQD